MSPRRADKKRLKSENPRKTATPVKGKTPRYRVDGATLALSIVALVLLVLVVFMLIRRPGSGSNRDSLADLQEPVIERVAGEQKPQDEPVAELGVPETVLEPEEQSEPAGNMNQENPADATARLFFVKVSDEGNIGMKSVLRAVPSSASPLKTAINALMEGPRPGELSNDVLSLVPEDSSLIGARVEAGVAFLDFTEAFRFNSLGIEGYRAQVEQIVFTATEFPTVDKVQFLIEGQRIDFLGGEGFYVGNPIGRDDF